jgi:hypothetical protein
MFLTSTLVPNASCPLGRTLTCGAWRGEGGEANAEVAAAACPAHRQSCSCTPSARSPRCCHWPETPRPPHVDVAAHRALRHVAVADAQEPHHAPQLGAVQRGVAAAAHVGFAHNLQQRHAWGGVVLGGGGGAARGGAARGGAAQGRALAAAAGLALAADCNRARTAHLTTDQPRVPPTPAPPSPARLKSTSVWLEPARLSAPPCTLLPASSSRCARVMPKRLGPSGVSMVRWPPLGTGGGGGKGVVRGRGQRPTSRRHGAPMGASCRPRNEPTHALKTAADAAFVSSPHTCRWARRTG